MKANSDFILREMGKFYFIVPMKRQEFSKCEIIHTNETGAILWQRLQKESTEKELLHAIQSVYDIDDLTALSDIHAFLNQLQQIGAICPS